jgi:hypothetical protein
MKRLIAVAACGVGGFVCGYLLTGMPGFWDGFFDAFWPWW